MAIHRVLQIKSSAKGLIHLAQSSRSRESATLPALHVPTVSSITFCSCTDSDARDADAERA
eukprot:10408-Eustigmatos_ZCMA.PRE.1